MKFKKGLLIICLIICLFAISSVSASDANDMAMVSDDASEIELSQNDVMETDELQTSEEKVTLTQTDDDETVSAESDLNLLGEDSSTYSELSREIGSGGNIVLQHKHYTYDSGDTIKITIDNSVIDGNGAVIDMIGTNDTRVFEVMASGVTIKNLTIKNANSSDYGGAVYFFSSSGTVENCNFTNNNATMGGGAIFFNCTGNVINCNFVNNKAISDHDYGGGAIYMSSGSVLNCNFTNNHAESEGAIVVRDSGNVTNCNFTNNTAIFYGGAIGIMSGSVINCNFANNKAAEGNEYECNGGAIIMGSGSVINCNFANNIVSGDVDCCGGAIYMYSGSVTNCNFTHNAATSDGGAIYLAIDGTVEKCVFTENHANCDGGAIYLGNAYDCVFINNTADNGGAIYGSNATLCTFINNTASQGGAIYGNPDSKSEVVLCIFEGNTPENVNVIYPTFDVDSFISSYNSSEKLCFNLSCNGILFDGYNTTITVSNDDGVIGTYYGLTGKDGGWVVNLTPGIYNATLSLVKYESPVSKIKITITDGTTFLDLNRTINGNEDDEIILDNSYYYHPDFDSDFKEGIRIDREVTVNGNGHTIDGLQIARMFVINGSNSIIKNINLINGFASDFGGAICWYGANGSIINSTFNNNTCDNILKMVKGGAICWYGANGSISNSTFNNNTCYSNGSNSFGGAIYAQSDCSINDCNFTNNTAGSIGGAIYFESNGEVFNSTFYKNQALYTWRYYYENDFHPSRGGAIYISGSGVIANSKFYKNEGMQGIAIFSESNYLEVRDSEFLGNKAKLDTSHASFQFSLPSYLTFFVGSCPNNYINAIYKENNNIYLSNVTYWNGEIANSDDGNLTTEFYIPVNLIVFDGAGTIYHDALHMVNVNTSNRFTIPLDISLINFPNGAITFNMTHNDDDYYSYFSIYITLNIDTRDFSSSIEIITAESEFILGNCHINFTVENYTGAYIVITNEAGEIVFEKNITSSSGGQFDPLISPQAFIGHYDGSIFADLPASDGYYNITVYNLGTWQVIGCSDSKLFKILPVNSTVNVAALSEIVYNNPIEVGISGENLTTVNVTVYDSDKNIAFSQNATEGTLSLPVLPVGQYNITVFNYGNQNIRGCENSTLINILKANNNVAVSVEDVSYGNDAIIFITADVDGEYAVNVNGTVKTINVVNGVGNTSISLNAGEYRTNVSFNNSNYESAITNAEFNVLKLKTNITAIGVTATYNVNEDIVITLKDGQENPISGAELTVDLCGENKYTTGSDGQIIVATKDLAAGTYLANINFAGNENYLESNATVTVTINKADPTISVSADSISYGEDVVVNIVASIDGEYNVTVGDKSEVATVENGIASVEFGGLGAGTYDVVASYPGDDNYNAASANTTVRINKATPDIGVFAKSINYGEDLVVKVTSDDDLAYRVNVTVGNQSQLLRLKEGKRSLKFSDLAPGSYTVTALYKGDANYSSISVDTAVVVKPIANLSLFASASGTGVVVVNVTGDDDLAYRVNVTVGSQSKLLRLKDGKGTLKFDGFKVGTYDVVALYKGDSDHAAVSVNTSVEINRLIPNLSVSASAGGNGIVVVNVTCDVDLAYRVNVTVGDKSKLLRLKDGQGTLKFTDLEDGNYSVVALYKGDEDNAPVSVNDSVEVNGVIPNLSVSATAGGNGIVVVNVACDVDLAYRVNVTVGDQSKLLRLNEGQGSVKFTGLEVGTYDVVASYSGDANYKKASNTTAIEVKE